MNALSKKLEEFFLTTAPPACHRLPSGKFQYYQGKNIDFIHRLHLMGSAIMDHGAFSPLAVTFTGDHLLAIDTACKTAYKAIEEGIFDEPAIKLAQGLPEPMRIMADYFGKLADHYRKQQARIEEPLAAAQQRFTNLLQGHNFAQLLKEYFTPPEIRGENIVFFGQNALASQIMRMRKEGTISPAGKVTFDLSFGNFGRPQFPVRSVEDEKHFNRFTPLIHTNVDLKSNIESVVLGLDALFSLPVPERSTVVRFPLGRPAVLKN